MDDLFDFLQQDTEPTVDASLVEFDGFAPTGFIAPWTAEVLYSQGSETEFGQEDIGYKFRRKAGDWGWFYYFPTVEVAAAAKDIMGAEYSATAEWCFSAVTADVVNFGSDAAREAFGVDLFYSWRVAGVGANKHVEFHHVILPAAVAAVATLQGIDNPGFDITPLSELDDAEYSWKEMDESEKVALRLQTLPLIGGKVGDEKVELEDAYFWKQRTELWQALGEDNPKASQPLGSGGDFATTSEQLNQCLRVYYNAWPQPFWLRLIPSRTPRPDGMTKAGKRLNMPVITEFFSNQAEAEKAAGGTATVTATTEPAIPAMWADIPEDFKAEVAKLKADGGNLPAFKKAGGEKTFTCTWAEIEPWLAVV